MEARDLVIVPLEPRHWDQVRRIFQEGIDTGLATFETEAPDWSGFHARFLPHSRLVALDHGSVQGWAALSAVSSRRAYQGVAEVSVYVAHAARGRGVGAVLLDALIGESERNGIWTLQATIFPENAASARLHERAGFRTVGRRERIGRLHGRWRDTMLLERRSPVVEAQPMSSNEVQP